MSCKHGVAKLASNTVGQVTVCQCGTVQLTLGPVTIRVELERLPDVANLLNDAVQVATEGLANAGDDPRALHN